VRFDIRETLTEGRVARRFFDRLGGAAGPFPKLSQLRAQTVTINMQPLPGQSPSTDEQRGWRFSSADGACHVTLLPDSLALETTAYRSWDEFAPHLERTLTVLGDEVDPAIEERLGLRFVNVILLDDVREPAGWVDYIQPDFLAPARHPTLGAGLTGAHHRITLGLGDELRCLLNYGLSPDPSNPQRTGYLVDLDTYREPSGPFEAADVFKMAAVMNDRNVSLFQQVVTPKLRALLRGGGKSDEGERT